MNTAFKRIPVWVIAPVAVILFFAVYLSASVGMVAIGFVGAIKQCGIKLLTSSEQVTTPSSSQPPSSTANLTTASTVDPSAIPDFSVRTVASTTSASEAYFNQFSAAQQAEMKKNAATIVTVGENRPEKLTRHDIETAVGVSIQESHLTNLAVAYDHDSLGIFQQRPSVGSWGTAEQILDPVHASNAFYDALVRIPVEQRNKLSLKDLGIKVQIPDKAAYNRDWKWDTIAAEIVSTYSNGKLGDSTSGGSDVSGSICSASAGSQVASGKWQLPLAQSSYCILDGFGMRVNPYSHVTKMHNGVDLACNKGNPIYAAADGTVLIAGQYGGYGNFVKIQHAGNVTTGYGHMVRIADGVSTGAHVSAGQLIGYVGSTGDSTGPHLHFEVTVNGAFTNPVPFMATQGVKLN